LPDAKDDENPFRPPASDVLGFAEPPGAAYRVGPWLLARDGAELPDTCALSGAVGLFSPRRIEFVAPQRSFAWIRCVHRNLLDRQPAWPSCPSEPRGAPTDSDAQTLRKEPRTK
jgi:hypothetical protein